MNCFTDKDNRIAFKEMLQKEVIEVTFTKVNGEERTMKCTLKPDIITDVTNNEKESIDIMDTTAIRVFDVDKNAWRSFRWDSVKEIILGVPESV